MERNDTIFIPCPYVALNQLRNFGPQTRRLESGPEYTVDAKPIQLARRVSGIISVPSSVACRGQDFSLTYA